MNASERAAQIWALLSYAASHRQTLTYDILGRHIGVPQYALAQLLAPIQDYCMNHSLPGLTAIVVKQDGYPGDGFIAAEDVPREQQRVFMHDWLEESTPTVDDFLEAADEAG